jgi:hypothetical protein
MIKKEELFEQKTQWHHCHYSDLPSPSAYIKPLEIPMDNIVEISVSDDNVEIKYEDGTKHFIKGEVKIIRGLLNDNDSPIVDHCI